MFVIIKMVYRNYIKYIILIIIAILVTKVLLNYHNRLSDTFTPKKVVYINLDERTDRKKEVERQIKDTGLMGLERVSAYNGKKLRPEDYYPQVLSQEGLRDLNSKDKQEGLTLTNGGLGCMLSHRKIWQEIAKQENGDYYLVLEDDAIVDINIKKHMNQAMKQVPSDWDVIYLGTGQQHGPVKVNDYFSSVKRIYCLHGYLMNKSGAKKALKHCFPARYQIDTELWLNYKSNNMNAYVLNNLLIKQNKGFNTDIQIK